MTDPSTAPPPPVSLADIIAARLREALDPSHLQVVNDSHHHAGHMGDDGTGESHFSVVVETPRFTGMNRVARQRLVNAALGDLLATRIHALAIKARAPGDG